MEHIYKGMLLNHKKECIWVSSSEVDEPRICYTDWSKSEKQSQIYILTHIYEIKKNGTDKPICRAGIES